jgi:NitT/TauT family transport system ATP-binding protein
LVQADVNGRKRILHHALRRLGLFAYLVRLLDQAQDHRLPAEVITEQLILALPGEDPGALLQTVISWGRYGELIGYDPNHDWVYLDEEGTAAHAVGA